MVVVGSRVSKVSQWTQVCHTDIWKYTVPSGTLADRPLRTSMIFYMGMEGLGGLEMETDEDENVCLVNVFQTSDRVC